MKKLILRIVIYCGCGLAAFALADIFKAHHDIILFVSGYFTCNLCESIKD